jgi:hypothetical protein
VENQDEQEAENDRPEHRIDVDSDRITGALVPDPFAGFGLANLQILEMVRNVLG